MCEIVKHYYIDDDGKEKYIELPKVSIYEVLHLSDEKLIKCGYTVKEIYEAREFMKHNGNDMATDEQIEEFKNYVESKGYDFFPIMAAIRYDVDPMLKKIQEMLSKLPPIVHYEAEPAPVVNVEDFDDHSVTIKNVNGIYTVEADWLLQVMKGINFDDYESLNYFQKVLINGGVIDALREKGCNDGDTVSIYDVEFDFMD